MNHPFIGDLSDKSLDEIQNIISKLTTKLTFASRMGNQPMVNQLLMALDSYKTAYQIKMDALVKKQNMQEQINITKATK
jgi:hypothetical protein